MKNTVLVDGTEAGNTLFDVEFEFSSWTTGFGACSFNFILTKAEWILSLLNKCTHKILNVLVITKQLFSTLTLVIQHNLLHFYYGRYYNREIIVINY